MNTGNTPKDSIEQITSDLKKLHNRLSNLVWSEGSDTSSETLSELYLAHSHLSQALANIHLIRSE
ncbi:hypothetical protein HW132_34260 [Brasilonema sp. CT11]|nr:hypothetical protein [Brasilonema sp. CT11]